MRIAQIITGSEAVGGAQTHVRDLALGLQAYGHDVTVLVGPPAGTFQLQLAALGVPTRTLMFLSKRLNPAKDVIALAEVVALLAKLKPDIVAAHTAKAGFIGRFASALLHVPCVFTPHGLSIVNRKTGETDRVFLSLERLAGRITNRIIAVCEEERSLAIKMRLCPPNRLNVVYNGIPDRAAKANPANEPCTIVMVARFQEQKDHRTLLHALALLDYEPWRLQLVGDGPLVASIRDEARSLGLAGRIDFVGPHADPPELLDRAQIFVLSTHFEAFPISILEAMRAGLPVVASNVGGISRAVQDGVTGLLAAPADPRDLAAKLRRLLLEKNLRRSFGMNGRRRYIELFTEAAMVSQTLQVYQDVICRNPLTAKTTGEVIARKLWT